MKHCIINFITLFLLAFDLIIATDYCKLCKKGSHTLCRYKDGPSDNCIDYKKPDISSSVKKYIVDVHNDIRNHIASGQEIRGLMGRQPAASNMNILQWNHELAEIAQRWADQCVDLNTEIQHDQCRKTGRFEVGQNVLTALTASLDVPEIAILILNWYKQVESVLPSDIEIFSGIQRGKFIIGQYTQLVWADTRFVGCGMSTFRNTNLTDITAKYLHRLVCNYGPRGNLIGSPVYNRGIPCSKCANGRCDSVRNSLCQGIGSEESPSELDTELAQSRSTSKENIKFHVELPISLFNTLSLGYILKHNLTGVINYILQRVNVHTGPKEIKRDSHVNETLKLDQILAVLASLMPQYNISEKDNEFDPISNRMMDNNLRSALTRTSNILYQDDTFYKLLNRRIFDLENGQVFVDDCKHDVQQCQYEDEGVSAKLPLTGDIILPNNMIYRKLKGVWFHGRCRCNYVYRSCAHSHSVKYFKRLLILLVFQISYWIPIL